MDSFEVTGQSVLPALLTKPSSISNYLVRANELCPQSSAVKEWKQLVVAAPEQAAAQGLRPLLQPEASLHFQADRASSCCYDVCSGGASHAEEGFGGRWSGACDAMNPVENDHLCTEKGITSLPLV